MTKPHIWFADGLWHCGPGREYALFSDGRTPKIAYDIYVIWMIGVT